MCRSFLLSMSLILLYPWPEAECLLSFSVVVISVDVKNKALKVLCIGLHTRREELFTKLLVFIISESWHVKSSSKDSSLLVRNGLVHVGIMGKKCIIKLFEWHPWMFKTSISSWHMFVSIFETSSKSINSMLSTSNISSDVHWAEQWQHSATLPMYWDHCL